MPAPSGRLLAMRPKANPPAAIRPYHQRIIFSRVPRNQRTLPLGPRLRGDERRSSHLHAFFGEVFYRAGMPWNWRVGLDLVFDREAFRFLINGDQIGFVIDDD